MEALFVIAVGMLCVGSAIIGFVKPTEFRAVLLDWFAAGGRRLQVVGGILVLVGIMMLATSLPPQSTNGWIVTLLGSLILLKGGLTYMSSYNMSLHKRVLDMLKLYKSNQILWSIHCASALIVGIFLTLWGITH
jgi:hypothetical protein